MRRSKCSLAVVLLVAGCTAPASPSSSEHIATFPPTEAVERLRLPFDAYDFSVAELYTLANAEDLLAHECMEARGYDWEIIVRPTDLKDLVNRRRYGVIEIEIAQQFGYHVPAGLLTPLEVEQQLDRRDSGLSESQSEAAYGVDGCMREAVRSLQPETGFDPDLFYRLNRASLDDSQDEHRVVEAMRSWRDCVRSAGVGYQDPFEAMSDSSWWADGSLEPSGQEIAVAVADVQCKDQTGLVEMWHAAEVRIQEEAIADHADYFQELGAAKGQQLAAANTVLDQS